MWDVDNDPTTKITKNLLALDVKQTSINEKLWVENGSFDWGYFS